MPYSAHPERQRDRPEEASATVESSATGANSGRSNMIWKMRDFNQTIKASHCERLF